jgi:SAM-dependent methyltransferase
LMIASLAKRPEASRLLRQSLPLVGGPNLQTMDAGCGDGRNAVLLADVGRRVWAVDRDLGRLSSFVRSPLGRSLVQQGRVNPVCSDLNQPDLPFRHGAFGLVVLVHFLPQSLSPLTSLVVPEGYLFIETIGGQGGNWLALPPAGTLERVLGRDFSFCFYKEQRVGKLGTDAVCVRLLAKRHGRGRS